MIINKLKIFSGIVVKRSGEKTFKVKILIWKKITKKYDFKFKTFDYVLVHDEKDNLQIGQNINFFKLNSGKISKRKSFIYLS